MEPSENGEGCPSILVAYSFWKSTLRYDGWYNLDRTRDRDY